jgi:hypothetical protein
MADKIKQKSNMEDFIRLLNDNDRKIKHNITAFKLSIAVVFNELKNWSIKYELFI